jgi:hypothetical protein
MSENFFKLDKNQNLPYHRPRISLSNLFTVTNFPNFSHHKERNMPKTQTLENSSVKRDMPI